MSEELERRWDDAVETAWREFRQRLADRLAGMGEGDSIVVELPHEHEDGASPYCQVAGGERLLRVEAVSNVYLADECRLDVFQEGFLEYLGFCRPDAEDWSEGEANFWADVDQREADRAAVMIVRALREVYAVVHPIWLDADGLEPAWQGARPLPPKSPRSDRARTPVSQGDVRAAVDLAVAELYEEPPEWDEDGDLPLVMNDHIVWITVSKQAPRILIHCTLVDGVEDGAGLLGEINKLNNAEFGLTFLWREGRVSVTRELGLETVVPQVLSGVIARIVSQVDDWGAGLKEHLSAAATRSKRGERSGRFGTAYAVMVELERAQRGSVGPATLVQIFHGDTGLLLKAIRVTEQRRREMRSTARRAKDEGRVRAARVARARQDYMRDLTERMRAALRLMVDAPVRKVQLDQLALFDEDEAGTNG